jgi:hypothetical protein
MYTALLLTVVVVAIVTVCGLVVMLAIERSANLPKEIIADAPVTITKTLDETHDDEETSLLDDDGVDNTNNIVTITVEATDDVTTTSRVKTATIVSPTSTLCGFGETVILTPMFHIVAAPGHGSGSGVVYVYRRDNGKLHRTIYPSTIRPGQRFGTTVIYVADADELSIGDVKGELSTVSF